MAYANRYRGNGLVVQWIWTGGTVTITGDQTIFDVDRSDKALQVTAGNVSDEEYIAGIKDGSAKLTFFDTGNAGTALLAALAEGNFGTLQYGPQGTATGKPKKGFAALIKNRKENYPINDAVKIDVDFQKSGAMLFDDGVVW